MTQKSIYILVALLLPLLTAFFQSDAVAAADCGHCMPQHSLSECGGIGDRFASGEKGCACQSRDFCRKNDVSPNVAAPVSAVDGATVRQRCLFKTGIRQPRHPSPAAILPPPEMHLPLFILNCSFLI